MTLDSITELDKGPEQNATFHIPFTVINCILFSFVLAFLHEISHNMLYYIIMSEQDQDYVLVENRPRSSSGYNYVIS